MAQSTEPGDLSGLITQQVHSGNLPGPQHLRDYVSEGKLRLSLREAVLLTLENNSSVRIDEAQVEAQKFALLRTYQPFDPQLLGKFNANRISYTASAIRN